ncbi:MAG: glycosyltransferase [Muribaculaceae bacterium]|nr:glycosyltransferase [Muribaculaceae bacterium]
MRILHIITSLRVGGAERLMVDLLPRLSDMGNEVELLLFDGIRTPFYSQLELAGIKLHYLSINRNVYHPVNLIKLFCFIRKNRFDIVHTHNAAPQLFAAIVGRFFHMALCTTEHNTNNRRRNLRWYASIDRWMYRQYKRIICITDKVKDNLESHIGSSQNLFVINNGIDCQRFYGCIKDVRGKCRYVLAMVGSFSVQKDQDSIIRALSVLPPCYELRLIGDGPRREELEKLAIKLNVSDRVSFLGIRDDVPQQLKHADVVVHSSHWEGFGLAAVEGMAAGIPVIVSDVPGLADIVRNYGIVVPAGDHYAVKEAILKLTGDAGYYQEVASRCQERAMQFDIGRMAEKYNNLYKNLDR